MPNWCEGTLKVRGKTKDLKRFVLEGLQPVGLLGDAKDALTIDKHGNCYSDNTCHIENTHRGFVESLDIYFEEDEEEIDIIALESKFAWAISASDLQRTCIKYNVDMKIYGFELGMEFNQDIEIVDGVIVKDKEINFDGKNYKWECIMPNMGG